jgi:divalent metal cation (Fe/Co/Zn/Cd) transporter
MTKLTTDIFYSFACSVGLKYAKRPADENLHGGKIEPLIVLSSPFLVSTIIAFQHSKYSNTS